jgi:uncharacterized RDD family membrane protein YckC
MSSMPERDTPGQPGSAQQGAPAGEWTGMAGEPAPDQDQRWGSGGAPGGYVGGPEGGTSGQWDTGYPQAGAPGQPGAGQTWGNQPGWDSPVNEAETRVTWRRIFQYWVDAFLVSIVPYLVSIPFDRNSRTLMNVLGGVIYVVLFILIGLWYWVIRPHSHSGQTFAMKWFGLRVISKDGGPANMTQLFVRWICLLVDSAPWMWPLTGLVGLIVMLCSRYRQRIGDHVARTLVVDARFGRMTGPRQYAGAGTSDMSRQF